MNAYMNIQVRVISAAAMAQLRALEMQGKKTAMGVGGVGRQAQWGLPFLSKWGNQVQWAGRQLMYNFTLPIALAMGAATKFALENEKAMTRVSKVYGDNSKQFNRLAKKEIPALGEAFEALSNKYGVIQKDVINIGADWAAAGASGIALAKSVDLTLQTMILGEIGAAEATQQLIAIQAQYGQSTAQLTKTIEILNMVENQTGVSMKGLMDGLSRAAGVARTAGVDVEHLAAMMAALVPATGSAATAGNGLKTIISRVLSPTKEATDVMREMGVEVDKLSWQGMTATERLEAMADQFHNLSDAQQAHVSTVMASRWQVNRFVTLMRDVTNENGYYQKSLRASSDEQALFTQRQKELNRVMTSNPQMLKQTWVILQNAMAKVIVPLLPYIVYLAQQLAHLANKFANLDPEIQKLVLAGLVFIAIIGPIARYVGSVTNLVGLLSAAFHFFAKTLGITAVYSLLFTKKVVDADGVVTRSRRSILALGKAMLLLPFKFLIGGFRMLAGSAVLGGIGAMVRGVITALGFISVVAYRQMIAVQAFAAGMISTPPLIIRVFGGFILAMGTLFGRLAPMATAAAIGVGRGLALIGPAAAAAYAAVLAGTRGFMVSLAALWRTLPLLLGAVSAGVGVALLRMKAMFAGLIVASKVSVTGVAVVWRTLPLLIAAVGNGVLTAIVSIGMLFMRLPALAAAGIARLGAVLMVGLRALPALILRVGPLLLGAFRAVFGALASLLPLILRVITGPIGIGISIALGLAYAFRDKLQAAWVQIVETFHNAAKSLPGFFEPIGNFFEELGQKIMDAFWALPAGVRDAMIAVLTVVRDAALQVYEWMSYLNPFARHSPSLVEQVTKGMDEIGGQYARAGGMGKGFKQLHAALEAAIKRQEKVVDVWKHKLDQANHALDTQQWKLDRLRDKLDEVSDAYNSHREAMESYAAAPIQGMEKMNDKIFANEIAQKRLRLEMLQFEKANGSIDSMQSRLQALYGELELLRGTSADLRSAGAGSDVLGPIDAQIASLEKQAAKLTDTVNANPVDEMQKQMDELERKGEMLQLTYDIKFDPLTRQIENLANSQKELSYDQIVNGIRRERDAMAQLQPAMDRYTNAVKNQEAVVDRYTLARDKIQRRYDAENDKLQHMKDRLQEVGAAMDKVAKKGKKASEGYTPVGVETFRAGKGANWADPGQFQKIGREGGMKDQSALIRKFAEDANADMAEIFGSFDMFGPIKRWWRRTWTWLKENVGPVVRTVRDGIVEAFGSIPNPFEGGKGSGIVKGAKKVWDTVADVVRTVWGWIKSIIRLFAPDFKRMWDEIVKGAKRIWNEVGPELAKFGKIFKKLPEALQGLWKVLKPIIAILGVSFLAVLKVLASVIGHTLGPVIDFLVDIFKAFIRTVRGALGVLVGLFSGDWKMLWQGVKDMVGGTFDAIGAILKGAVKIIWGIVKGIVGGIVGFFKWLWDELVGHSIVPDIVNGIFDVFKTLAKLPKWVWNKLVKPIIDFFVDGYKELKKDLGEWWSGIKQAWSNIKSGVKKWWLDSVWNPIKNGITDWWRERKAVWRGWWENIKEAWSNIKSGVKKWWMDSVWNPVKNAISDWWRERKAVWRGWWEDIKQAWSNIKSGEWWDKNVLQPIKKAITDAWNGIKNWFRENKDGILAPIVGVINAIISAINLMIRGMNKIADVLPGISWEIELIPKLASGGDIPSRRVGSGFKTNGARAIVGEGKANYPEYVIPTDPTYRNRARALYEQAGRRIGMAGIPMHADGGILGSISNAVGSAKDWGGDAWDWAKGKAKSAVSAIFAPFRAMINSKIAGIDWNYGRMAARSVADQLFSWVGNADKVYADRAKDKPVAPTGGGGPSPQAGDWERIYWRGHQFNVRTVRMIQAAEKMIGQAFHITQGSWSTSVAASGSTHSGGGVFDATSPVTTTANSALRKAGFASWIRSPAQGPWPYHIHAVALGDKQASASAKAQMLSYLSGGDGLRTGGIVRRNANKFFKLGDGPNDEAVVPLPRNWRTDILQPNGGGATVININGNLEFPNITDGSDAEEFVKNLVILAKD